MNAGKYFYAADEGLKEKLGAGLPLNRLEDWCNEKRSKGIDAYAGNWSSSSEVYSEKYAKGQIVSYEISSYSTGQKYDISDRLPLDVRFSIVVSKGKYYKLENSFDKVTAKEGAATVNDVIKYLAEKNITFVLAGDISTDDYDMPARIAGVSLDGEIYDDASYTIEKVTDGNYWKVKSAPVPTPGA